MRDIIKEDVPYQPLALPTQRFRHIESVRVLEDEMLVAEEKEIEADRYHICITQGEMLMLMANR